MLALFLSLRETGLCVVLYTTQRIYLFYQHHVYHALKCLTLSWTFRSTLSQRSTREFWWIWMPPSVSHTSTMVQAYGPSWRHLPIINDGDVGQSRWTVLCAMWGLDLWTKEELQCGYVLFLSLCNLATSGLPSCSLFFPIVTVFASIWTIRCRFEECLASE